MMIMTRFILSLLVIY